MGYRYGILCTMYGTIRLFCVGAHLSAILFSAEIVRWGHAYSIPCCTSCCNGYWSFGRFCIPQSEISVWPIPQIAPRLSLHFRIWFHFDPLLSPPVCKSVVRLCPQSALESTERAIGDGHAPGAASDGACACHRAVSAVQCQRQYRPCSSPGDQLVTECRRLKITNSGQWHPVVFEVLTKFRPNSIQPVCFCELRPSVSKTVW